MKNIVEDALKQLESDISELKACLPGWDHDAGNIEGSRRYRGVAKRIVLSAQRVQEAVKENTFQR